MKSILFVAGRFGVGGVERVTVTLANELVVRGYNVCVVAFQFERENMLRDADARVKRRELSFPAFTLDNLRGLRDIVIKCGVDVVINQWALPAPLSIMLRIAMRGCNATLITVEHNSPLMNAGGLLRRCLVLANLYVVYSISRHFVYLSSALVLPLMRATVIPNPVKVSPCVGIPKENVILFVGRISMPDKRPDRLLEVWRHTCDRLPDWRLVVVGDGPDLNVVKTMAGGLPRVSFEGFQDPDDYYERARILVQTSSAEGFGLVLVEAMAHGCVPVTHSAVATAREIIGDCGHIVEGGWKSRKFADEIVGIAGNFATLVEKSERCRSEALKYLPENIVKRYESLWGC